MRGLLDFLKAIGEETRIKIVTMLCREELCVNELIDKLNLSQPAISHHLRILKQARLITDRREGKWIYYSLNRKRFAFQEKSLQKFIMRPVALSRYRPKLEPGE